MASGHDLGAALIGWFTPMVCKGGVSWRRASIAAGLIWLTHVLVDCFNLYGTGIEPSKLGIFSLTLHHRSDVYNPITLCHHSSANQQHNRRWRLPLSWIKPVYPALMQVGCDRENTSK